MNKMALYRAISYIFLLIFAVFLSPKIVRAEIKTVDKFSPRVYLLIFNPTLTTKNNFPFISFEHYNNPEDLAASYSEQVRLASHGIINYRVIDKKIVNDIPLKQDGFKYTEESYLNCLSHPEICHNKTPDADFADYQKILADNQICQMVNNNQIDELWMFGGPWMGFYEANMAGAGGFYTNGPVITNTTCQKPLHIMGFSYERNVSEMVHDLGHRLEGTMTNFLPANIWNQYKSNSGCGEIHYPPNTPTAYDYTNNSTVNSNCADWNNYPDLKNETKNTNCQAWGCSEMGYYQWWIKHLPVKMGVNSQNVSNNWWTYATNAKALIPGDVIINDKVDIYDFNAVVADFNKRGAPGFIPADIDNNGIVDIFDYNIVVTNFGMPK